MSDYVLIRVPEDMGQLVYRALLDVLRTNGIPLETVSAQVVRSIHSPDADSLAILDREFERVSAERQGRFDAEKLRWAVGAEGLITPEQARQWLGIHEGDV